MIDLAPLRRRRRGQPELIIISLIDVMMVLLIFLLSTAAARRDAGLAVERPRAQSAGPVDPGALLIGVGPAGELTVEGRRVDRLSLRSLLKQKLAGRRDGNVVLVADQKTPAGLLVSVMDEARLGGAQRVAIAADRRRP